VSFPTCFRLKRCLKAHGFDFVELAAGRDITAYLRAPLVRTRWRR
jgi:hypothetical protein